MDKAQYHSEIAAKGGHEIARYHLGLLEKMFYGSTDRAMKHFMISASAGYEECTQSKSCSSFCSSLPFKKCTCLGRTFSSFID